MDVHAVPSCREAPNCAGAARRGIREELELCERLVRARGDEPPEDSEIVEVAVDHLALARPSPPSFVLIGRKRMTAHTYSPMTVGTRM